MKFTRSYCRNLLEVIAVCLFAIPSFGQQSIIGNLLRLNPTGLSATCQPGDTRFDSSGHKLNLCYPANTWTAVGSGAGGTWGTITGTLSAQTDLNTALGLKAPLASPIFSGALTSTQISTPSNPAASKDSLYFKSDDNLYRLNSSGVELPVSIGALGSTVAAGFGGDNTITGTLAYTGGSPVILPKVYYDTNGAYNNSTGVYTIPVSGYYNVAMSMFFNGTTADDWFVFKNGNNISTRMVNNGGTQTPGVFQFQAVAGDQITLVSDNSGTLQWAPLANTPSGYWPFASISLVGLANTSNGTSIALSSWSGYTGTAGASTWSDAVGGAFVNGTNSGGNAITQRFSNGLTVTAGGSNVAGITFTPANAGASYIITASTNFFVTGSSGITALRLTDGTNVISTIGGQDNATGAQFYPATLAGLYTPGTTSPVTVKIQLQNVAGASSSFGGVTAQVNSIEWTIIQIPTNIIGSTFTVNSFGSTPNANGASFSAGNFNLQPADATHPGGMTIGGQTFAGSKVFGSNLNDSFQMGANSSTAVHFISGGVNQSINNISSNYTQDTSMTDYIIRVNCSAACTITLLAPTNGRTLRIVDVSGAAFTNNITITPNGGNTINGNSNLIINVNNGSVDLIGVAGTGWNIL